MCDHYTNAAGAGEVLGGIWPQSVVSIAERTPRRHFLWVLAIVAGHKAALTALAFLCPVLFPALFTTTSGTRMFQTWDAGAYFDIAHGGYSSRELCAFYPLWPACIRVGSWCLGGRALMAGYVLANLFSLGALLLFYRLVCEKEGPETAYRSTLLLLLFPGAMFFFVPYSESLFFLLLMACLLCIHHRAYAGAAVAATLLPLTRATGIFVLPLIAWAVFQNRASLRTYAICIGPIAGYATYFGIMWRCTGNAATGFQAQQEYLPSRLSPTSPTCQDSFNVSWGSA